MSIVERPGEKEMEMVEGGAVGGEIFVAEVTGWLRPSPSPPPLMLTSPARGRCAYCRVVI
jgi:hypothetical protein